MVRTNGSFVAGYEAVGLNTFYQDDAPRNNSLKPAVPKPTRNGGLSVSWQRFLPRSDLSPALLFGPLRNGVNPAPVFL